MFNRCLAVPAVLCVCCGSPSDARDVELASPDVRLADLATPPAADAGSIGTLIVARIPEGRTTLVLTPERQKTLLRRRVPGRHLTLLSDERLTLHLGAPEHAFEQEPRCLALAVPLEEGKYLDQETVEPVDCRDGMPQPLLTFDRRVHALRATGALPAGAYLGHLFVAPGRVIGTDAELHLVFRAGPVAVERDVRPLTSARPDQTMLVQTEDGQVLGAPLAATGDRR